MSGDRSRAGINRDIAAQADRQTRRAIQQVATLREDLDAAEADIADLAAIDAALVPKGSITTSDLTQATNALLGRVSASTGAIEELTNAALSVAGVSGAHVVGFDSGNNLRKFTAASLAGSGGAVVSTASVAFTDGDTARRVTVADAAVGVTSLIVGTVRRPNVEEVDDLGFVYTANIVKVSAGSFDLLIACCAMDGQDTTEQPPSETIEFLYVVYTP